VKFRCLAWNRRPPGIEGRQRPLALQPVPLLLVADVYS
jgi:hypothetical protein